MQVFVLLGVVEYEGSDLLGVYSSRELAESARDAYVSSDVYAYYHCYDVAERSLDAAVSVE